MVYSISLLAQSDCISAESFVDALDRLGVLDYTSNVDEVQRVSSEPKSAIRVPKYCLGKKCAGHAEEVVKGLHSTEESTQSILARPFAQIHSQYLDPPAAQRFSMHMSDLALLLSKHGISIDRLPNANQIFSRDPLLMSENDGISYTEKNFGYVRRDLDNKEAEMVALHEGIHLASASLFCCRNHSHTQIDKSEAVLFGTGLQFVKERPLFRRLNEGCTDILTSTVLGAPTSSPYNKERFGENALVLKLLQLINKHYKLHQEEFNIESSDGEDNWLNGAGYFMLCAYFAHDLTFYGLLYHAVGRKRFVQLACDTELGVDKLERGTKKLLDTIFKPNRSKRKGLKP